MVHGNCAMSRESCNSKSLKSWAHYFCKSATEQACFSIWTGTGRWILRNCVSLKIIPITSCSLSAWGAGLCSSHCHVQPLLFHHLLCNESTISGVVRRVDSAAQRLRHICLKVQFVDFFLFYEGSTKINLKTLLHWVHSGSDRFACQLVQCFLWLYLNKNKEINQ